MVEHSNGLGLGLGPSTETITRTTGRKSASHVSTLATKAENLHLISRSLRVEGE